MLHRMSTHLDICKDKLLAAQFQELVFEDALGVVQSRVNQVGHPVNGLTLPEWEIVMRDEHMSNYIVMFLRLLTSAEIQLNRESFEPFILVRHGSFIACIHTTANVIHQNKSHNDFRDVPILDGSTMHPFSYLVLLTASLSLNITGS